MTFKIDNIYKKNLKIKYHLKLPFFRRAAYVRIGAIALPEKLQITEKKHRYKINKFLAALRV